MRYYTASIQANNAVTKVAFPSHVQCQSGRDVVVTLANMYPEFDSLTFDTIASRPIKVSWAHYLSCIASMPTLRAFGLSEIERRELKGNTNVHR